MDDREQYDRAAERHPTVFIIAGAWERYCVASGLAVRMIPGDRCAAHGDAPAMCATDVRLVGHG